MTKVLSNIVEWQLEHPEGTKDACEQWLKDERAAGRISFDVPAQSRAAPAKRGRSDGRGSIPKKVKKDKNDFA
jgi:tRNA nucleotidyltransferase (CCA-adding enzyme)